MNIIAYLVNKHKDRGPVDTQEFGNPGHGFLTQAGTTWQPGKKESRFKIGTSGYHGDKKTAHHSHQTSSCSHG